jgi:Xaa-Pro aminopeptidase
MIPKVKKIKRLLRENNIDGLIVNSPENFTYITAYSSHQHTVSRQPHFAVSVLDNKDENKAIAIGMDFETEAFSDYMECEVKKYSTWVGGKTFEEVLKNEEVSSNKKFVTSLDIVIESIKELGLEDKTVGIELDFVPVSYYESLKEIVLDDGIQIFDSEPDVEDMRELVDEWVREELWDWPKEVKEYKGHDDLLMALSVKES